MKRNAKSAFRHISRPPHLQGLARPSRSVVFAARIMSGFVVRFSVRRRRRLVRSDGSLARAEFYIRKSSPLLMALVAHRPKVRK